MQSKTFTIEDHAGVEIFVRKWEPKSDVEVRGIVQIAHGLGEHSARYEHVAKTLTDAGYIVYADDHRGHGKTAESLDKAGVLGPGGWEGTVRAMKNVTEKIIEEKSNDDLPVFLLGHSWGSYMSQDYTQEYADLIDGLILSGTNGKQPMLGILSFIGKLVTKIKGAETKAKLLDKVVMQPLNKPFEPARTDFDWLSRDEEVVDQYIEDPWCGFVLPNGFFIEMAKGLKKIWKPESEKKIPKDLPIYLFTGGQDPTNNMGEGMEILYERYKKMGIKDLSKNVYENARHETLNETNKEQVKQDLIDWLNEHS